MTVADLLPSRYYALACAIAVTVLASMAALFDSRWLLLAGTAGILSLLGIRDYVQTRRAILRDYPLLAYFRFFSRRYARRSGNICSRATTRRCRSRARNVRSFISAPRTSRAGNRSAPEKTCTSPVTNGSIIRCVRCRSTILISA